MRRGVRSLLSVLVLSTACAAGGPSPVVPQTESGRALATVVAFVRHAEKAADGTKDPPLTEPGQARANCLADVLEPMGPTALWATEYQRTRSTLEPLAKRTGQSVDVLPADDYERWNQEIRDAAPGSRIVVSAHSNTIPPIVSALGGDPGPLNDKGYIPDAEYDRMLWVVLDASGNVTTIRQRYCVVGS